MDYERDSTTNPMPVPQGPGVIQRLEVLEKEVQELRAQLLQAVQMLSNEQLRTMNVIGIPPSYLGPQKANGGALCGVSTLAPQYRERL